MTITHQFEVKDGGGETHACGNTETLTLVMVATGDVEYGSGHGSFTIGELILYYIDTEDPFTLVITGTEPYVGTFRRTIISGSPRAGGVKWWMNGGNVHITLSGPDVNSESEWQFGDTVPPLNLKIKVKRQSAANSGGCWGP